MSATTTQCKRCHDFFLYSIARDITVIGKVLVADPGFLRPDWGGGRQPFGQFLLKLHENVNTIGPKKGDNAPVNPRKTNKSFFKCTGTYMLKQIYISVEWRALQSTSRPTHKQM